MTPVYRFTMYDISSDTERESRRWGTRAAIERIGGKVMECTEIVVDEALLGGEIAGMTDRNFDSNQTKGFQTQVK